MIDSNQETTKYFILSKLPYKLGYFIILGYYYSSKQSLCLLNTDTQTSYQRGRVCCYHPLTRQNKWTGVWHFLLRTPHFLVNLLRSKGTFQNLYSQIWGNPIAVVNELQFSEPISVSGKKFYFVTASSEER